MLWVENAISDIPLPNTLLPLQMPQIFFNDIEPYSMQRYLILLWMFCVAHVAHYKGSIKQGEGFGTELDETFYSISNIRGQQNRVRVSVLS